MERQRVRRTKPQPAAQVEQWVAPTWAELVRDHTARVYRLAYRLTGNAQDAEDLTQDVFIRVFKSIHTFQPGTLEGWLHRITTNLFLDQARRRKRMRMDAVSTAPDHVWGSVSSAEDIHVDGEFDPDVQAALAALPPDQRVAVVLCDIEGLTYEQIAEVLDIKLGTVRSRISRGRAQLRADLAHRAPVEGHSRYLGVS